MSAPACSTEAQHPSAGFLQNRGDRREHRFSFGLGFHINAERMAGATIGFHRRKMIRHLLAWSFAYVFLPALPFSSFIHAITRIVRLRIEDEFLNQFAASIETATPAPSSIAPVPRSHESR